MLVNIYLIYDAKGKHAGYVGMTSKSLDQRLKTHFANAIKGGTWHVSCWLRKIKYRVKIKLLEAITTEDDWSTCERKWKKHFDNIGWDLKNETEGGEGVLGFRWSKEDRKRHQQTLKGLWSRHKHPKGMKGKRHNIRTKKRMKIAHTGLTNSVSQNKNISRAVKRFYDKNPKRSLTKQQKQAVSKGLLRYYKTHDGPNLGRKFKKAIK